MKQTIYLYGGAFNPPTVAHVTILSRLCEVARNMDATVWLLPSGQRRDKTIETSEAQRLLYLDALIADADTHGLNVRIELCELRRDEPTETIDTVRDLERRYPTKNFVWVFGTDSVLSMHEWHGGGYLLEQIDKIVVTRPGYRLSALPSKSRLLRVKTPQISSTLVRQCIQEGKSYDHLVTPRVVQAIAATMES